MYLQANLQITYTHTFWGKSVGTMIYLGTIWVHFLVICKSQDNLEIIWELSGALA